MPIAPSKHLIIIYACLLCLTAVAYTPSSATGTQYAHTKQHVQSWDISSSQSLQTSAPLLSKDLSLILFQIEWLLLWLLYRAEVVVVVPG